MYIYTHKSALKNKSMATHKFNKKSNFNQLKLLIQTKIEVIKLFTNK